MRVNESKSNWFYSLVALVFLWEWDIKCFMMKKHESTVTKYNINKFNRNEKPAQEVLNEIVDVTIKLFEIFINYITSENHIQDNDYFDHYWYSLTQFEAFGEHNYALTKHKIVNERSELIRATKLFLLSFLYDPSAGWHENTFEMYSITYPDYFKIRNFKSIKSFIYLDQARY